MRTRATPLFGGRSRPFHFPACVLRPLLRPGCPHQRSPGRDDPHIRWIRPVGIHEPAGPGYPWREGVLSRISGQSGAGFLPLCGGVRECRPLCLGRSSTTFNLKASLKGLYGGLSGTDCFLPATSTPAIAPARNQTQPFAVQKALLAHSPTPPRQKPQRQAPTRSGERPAKPKPPGCFQVLIKPSLPLGNPPASARASP